MFPLIYAIWAVVVLAAAFCILRRVRHDYQRYRTLKPFTAFLQVLMFFLHGILVSLSYGLDWSWSPASPYLWTIIIGVFLFLIGVGMLVSALGVFGPIGRMLGLKKDEMKRSGIYRWTRNPQLVGYGLMLWAIPFIWPSPYVVISVLLYLPIAHMMVLGEEEHLQNLFGQDYRDYCARTPRYLGIPKKLEGELEIA